MKFDYADAWLLGAIKLSESGDKGATLLGIIQAADYINHAIMTNLEFVTGTRRLKNIGLIIEKDKRLRTSDSFNEWWIKKYGPKSRMSIQKAIEEVEKYLKAQYGIMEEPTTDTQTEIADADWDKARREYCTLA